MTATEVTEVRGATRVPVRGLTVLYDAGCALCAFVRDWLVRQPQLVPLELVPAGSPEARRRFPGLDHGATLEEITVVGDAGQLYRGSAAWIVTLWALRGHRTLAHRLCTPTGARLAKGAVLAAAKWRGAQQAQAPRNAGMAQPGGAPWGGGVYRSTEGWTYTPAQGWTYTEPGCDGGTCVTR
ncbi:DCC1-like thiol-disulfide oxidoreductase family protein [Streptomyces sp. NPDC052051]|uniref:thiol-disulfide oxidoreductase DCC family protein n=1 Tax=Streptomyces sp. NPDC052051 TaxID=3154649 RepID=UPI00343DD5B9